MMKRGLATFLTGIMTVTAGGSRTNRMWEQYGG